MKKLFSFGMAIVAAGTAPVLALDVSSTTLSVTFDERNFGSVSRVMSRNGLDLGAIGAKTPLFEIEACRMDDFTGSAKVSATGASAFSVEKIPGGALLSYAFSTGPVERVVCTVRAPAGDGKVRWGIKTAARDGWAVTETRYPQIPLSAKLGSSEADDAFVLGTAKGGIVRSPGRQKPGWRCYGRQPGTLAAQFACLYDDRGGFYMATEDARGNAKRIGMDRTKDALAIQVHRYGFATADEQPYDVVAASFEGAPDAPADWHDAADIYKKWAVGRQWCATPLARRTDLPAWMKDAPAMVRFHREWLSRPENIRAWMRDFWLKKFPAAPLVTAYWGWEKRGCWVTPDYYPVYPDDEQFEKLVRDMRKSNAHAFPWPSGYHWTLLYDKRPDGSFAWDDRERFNAYARPHAVCNRDGKTYMREPSWLRGGNCTCLCGGDPWTIRWWNEEVCRPLVRLGCELIQVDQVVGGAFPPCWNRNHPHPPGEGVWKTDCFREQLSTMAGMMKSIEPDSVVCFEEPNEHFNHIVGIQDYRDCECAHEWASVFNYLYHEYVPCFQSNPRRGDRVWQAHEVVDGQIPHLTPDIRDFAADQTPIVNGAFDLTANSTSGFAGWERVASYKGVQWRGRAFVDMDEKKGGAASMRLENAPDEIVQVSQNVAAGDVVAFRPGAKFRFSAWIKTGKMANPNHIRLGVFAPGMRGMAGVQLPFPKAGSGWQHVSRDFTMPAGAYLIRIMVHVEGEAVAWVDDVALEHVNADGTVSPIRLSAADASYCGFMKAWVELYHGKGRDWLAFGRRVKPPRLICAEQKYKDMDMPCVFHAAYESLDGRKAVILANATFSRQKVILVGKGHPVPLTLAPDEIRLLER